jgi:succinyl-CoA synthetase beta subunit
VKHAESGDGYFDARRLIEEAGIAVTPAREVATAAEAIAAARAIGFPVVLKALASSHKSAGGGVRLGITDEPALEAAFEDQRQRLGAASWSVERMALATGGVELIAGVRWDHSFGPVLMVGAGGVGVEQAGDVAVALAPVSEELAQRLLRSLRVAPALADVDLRAAAGAASLLSRLAASRPGIAEIEVNPLLVRPDGAVALDARLVLS